MGYNPQESLENTIYTMVTLLGVHPIAPWKPFNTHCIYAQQKRKAQNYQKISKNYSQ